MPPLTVACDLTILHQLGHHAVEVVRLDLQRLGDLGNGDPGSGAHQLQGLSGTSVARTAAARATDTAAGAPRTVRPARSGRTAGAATRTHQGGTCGFELADLLLEFGQSAVDVPDRAIYEVSQEINLLVS